MREPRIPAESIAAGLVLLIGGAAVYAALQLGIGSLTSPEPGFFPLVAALLLVALSGMLLIRSFMRPPDEADQPEEGSTMRPALSATAALCLYVLVLGPLGYLIATALLVAAFLAVFRIKSLAVYILAVPSIAGGSYLLFHILLSLPLPVGGLGI